MPLCCARTTRDSATRSPTLCPAAGSRPCSHPSPSPSPSSASLLPRAVDRPDHRSCRTGNEWRGTQQDGTRWIGKTLRATATDASRPEGRQPADHRTFPTDNAADGQRIRTSPRRLTSPELPLHRFQRTSEVGLSLTVNDRFVFLTDRVILRTDHRTVKRRDNRNVKIYLPTDARCPCRSRRG